jgi:hypothetical protein
MTDAKNDLGMNIENVLESLRNFLSSEISEIKQNTASSSDILGKTKNLDLVNVKVKVRNTAPPSYGFGEVVFVGVGLTITCNATNQIFEKLKNTVKKHTVQQWQAQPRSTVIWYVNTWVESDDEGSNTHHAEKIKGDTLFPGETVDYEFNVPFESLPYISIKVDGNISPGNLFRSGQILQGFDKWSKPELIASIKALVDLKIHHPVISVITGIPEFGPKTTFEEITNFRKTVSESLVTIKNVKQSIQQLPKLHFNLEIHNFMVEVVIPYLNSFEKSCENTLAALASGNMEIITGSIKEIKIS